MGNAFPGARFLLPLFSWATVSPAECAQVRHSLRNCIPMTGLTNRFQVMWWRVWSSDPKWKTGVHEIDNRGNPLAPNKFVTLEGKQAIWEHAVKMTS
jgi:hypothetical protein